MNNPSELLIDLTLKNVQDIDEHLMTLFSLTISTKPSMILELGVRTGRSTLAFLYACNLINAKLFSVDIQDVKPDFNFPNDWKLNWNFIKMDAIKFLTEDFIRLRDMRSDYEKNRGDIIFIDDWHSGDHVKKELDLVCNVATPKDLIILHDLMYDNSQPNYKSIDHPKNKQWDNGGPYRPISELDLNIWEYMTIPRCHGLTLLRKKSNIIVHK